MFYMVRIAKIFKSLTMLMILSGFISGPFLHGTPKPMECCSAGMGCCCCSGDEDGNTGNDQILALQNKCCCRPDQPEQQTEYSINSGTEPIPISQSVYNAPTTNIKISIVLAENDYPSHVETIRNSGPPLYISHAAFLI
jgi:hypothetical protein